MIVPWLKKLGTRIFEKVLGEKDTPPATMRHKQIDLYANRSALNKALEKLADSTKDYNYTPPQDSAMCYSIRMPKYEALYFCCDECGQSASMCIGCKDISKCDGGCREAAHLYFGKIFSPDPLFEKSR